MLERDTLHGGLGQQPLARYAACFWCVVVCGPPVIDTNIRVIDPTLDDDEACTHIHCTCWVPMIGSGNRVVALSAYCVVVFPFMMN